MDKGHLFYGYTVPYSGLTDGQVTVLIRGKSLALCLGESLLVSPCPGVAVLFSFATLAYSSQRQSLRDRNCQILLHIFLFAEEILILSAPR